MCKKYFEIPDKFTDLTSQPILGRWNKQKNNNLSYFSSQREPDTI